MTTKGRAGDMIDKIGEPEGRYDRRLRATFFFPCDPRFLASPFSPLHSHPRSRNQLPYWFPVLSSMERMRRFIVTGLLWLLETRSPMRARQMPRAFHLAQRESS